MELQGFPHKISYRKVKYPRLEFTSGELLFVLPYNAKPEVLLKKHEKWIQKKMKFIEECLKDSKKKELSQRTEKEFNVVIKDLIAKTEKELGVKLNKLYVRKMKTKWASCSRKGNLTMNSLARYLPHRLLDYIVFHESAHLKQKRHNDKFWEIISKNFKNHNEFERELFIYWFRLNSKNNFGSS